MAKTLAITEQCPMELGLNILGGRWTLRILWQLSKEPVRFRELQRRLRPITTKTLTQQLQTLESQGMVERRVYPASPPQVEYRLSPVGQTILPLLQALCDWGRSYQDAVQPREKAVPQE
jgi:DNA-binding HxlR family transcriptional regulator